MDPKRSKPPGGIPHEPGVGTGTESRGPGEKVDIAPRRPGDASRDTPPDPPVAPRSTAPVDQDSEFTGGVEHVATQTMIDPVQLRRMQAARVLAEADASTIDEAPQPGGIYIVNGKKVDAFGKPVKEGGRRFADEE